MKTWKHVWREGLAVILSTRALKALRHALLNDDPRLIQRSTTSPPPAEVFHHDAVEGACALGYCGWRGEDLPTVGHVEAFFIRTCNAVDDALGEPGACRHFLNWFDETPRPLMRRQLLAEVTHELDHRQSAAA